MENILPTQEMSNKTPIQSGAPYFMGDEALVQFSSGEEGYGPDTYWLVNKKDHTIRPFESEMALDAAFGEDLEAALKNVVVISQPTMDNDGEITEGVLANFTLLGPEYAIKEDGTSKPLHFSSYQLKNRFGKDIDEQGEDRAVEELDGFLNQLKENEDKTGIPASYVEKIKNDSKLMAFYVSSIAYGKYSLKEVYSDILHTFEEENN